MHAQCSYAESDHITPISYNWVKLYKNTCVDDQTRQEQTDIHEDALYGTQTLLRIWITA